MALTTNADSFKPSEMTRATTIELHTGPALDPLAWLAATSTDDEAWYWEVPNDDTSWVGLGTAAVVNVEGAGRFADAATAAARLLDGIKLDAPLGAPAIRIAAGFAFDHHLHKTPTPWSAFGTGRLVLPAVQITRHAGRTWVTRVEDEDRPTPLFNIPNPSTTETAEPSDHTDLAAREHYRQLVRLALAAVKRGDLEKAVPCRSIQISHRPELTSLLAALRFTYPTCATLAVRPSGGAATFVGATPERLAAVHTGHLHTAALAGSAPRDPDPAIDASLGQGLLISPKERAEHAVVVDAIDRALHGLGVSDRHPRNPVLLQLHGIQHLHTPIDAELPEGVGLLELVGALHPTPAVSGYPGEPAAELRTTHEGMERGWFASPVGWLDATGDGEFRVALRTGLIHRDGTTLYAGAGVVAGSDPDRELAETDVKLRTLLGLVLAAESTAS
ncbi:MAG: isochorismate synthase [Acidimicrobiales bacterium]|nr:isochorismate synthase [Acidimicrobiales bacterium]